MLAFAPLLTVAPPRAAQAAEWTVNISTRLEPQTLTVPVGAAVRWTNSDGQRHRLRARSGPVEFDSGDIDPGGQFVFVFATPGSYPYRDERNPNNAGYQGTITVTADAGGVPGTGAGGTGGAPAQTSAAVSILDGSFAPTAVIIAVGGTVTWTNADRRGHTVTARDGSFDSGLVGAGAGFQRSFALAGRFDYFCAVHPDMTGSVMVADAAGAVPPQSTTPVVPPPTSAPTVPPPASATGDRVVSVLALAFSPVDITVEAGARVVWRNGSPAAHTVTSRSGVFDSGLLPAGREFARVFDTPGTFAYICAVHPEMTGTVIVGGAGGAPPPSTNVPAPQATAEAPSGPPRLVIADFEFLPRTVDVPAGTTVTWTNEGVAPHTVTARDGAFTSPTLTRGQTYDRVFTTSGRFAYICALHPSMVGEVVVRGEATPALTAGPSAQTVSADATPPTSDTAQGASGWWVTWLVLGALGAIAFAFGAGMYARGRL